MELPRGVDLKGRNSNTHVLRLLKNIYGQQQSGKVWSDYLRDKLISIGFVTSPVEKCLYIRRNVIFLFYVDDRIFSSPDASAIDEVIQDIKGLGLDMEGQGNIEDYLGVNVE